MALALVENGCVVLGALGCPELGKEGTVAIAIRGGGAWKEPLEGGQRDQLTVSQVAEPNHARLIQSVEPSHTNKAVMQRIRAELRIATDPVRMDSQVKYLLIASGEVDMMFRLTPAVDPGFRSMIWDQAAGSLFVEEAGGRVSDLDGQALDFSTGAQLTSNRGVLATNGPLHASGLSAIRGTSA